LQRCSDAVSNDCRIRFIRDKYGSKASWMLLGVDRVVVWPAARPLVFPVTAELDRHGSSDGRGMIRGRQACSAGVAQKRVLRTSPLPL
jgi:hypothetical protein